MELEADVIIVGGGPTGLMLAAELALAAVDVLVLERRPDQSLAGSRARGLQSRTIEVLDQRGVAERFLEQGQAMQINSFAGVSLDLSDFPSRHPYGLAISQAAIEDTLAAWVAELPARIRRDQDVVGVDQDETGATVQLADGSAVRARWVVGCDGGRSVVRKAAGIGFEGSDATTSYMLGEVTMPDSPALGFHVDAAGRHAIGPLPEGEGRVAVVIQEPDPQAGSEPTLEEFRDGVVHVWGTDFGLHSPTWLTRFTDAARQATAYRAGRILVAGDAAHVHSPMGGQGISVGVQDAVNLGWKLAQVIRGDCPDSLLDSYHEERHPVGAQVLQTTLALTAAARIDDRIAALTSILGDALGADEPRRQLAGRLAGLDIHYDLGKGHPLVGRRMPDLDLVTADGTHQRLYALLHSARPLLLDLRGAASGFDASRWSDRLRVVSATHEGPWNLPVIGVVEAPAAVLVRPDGHVGWVGTLDDPALPAALTTWVGARPQR